MTDKMLRVAGRDNEGKARAIKTDTNGRIETTPQRGESEIIVFSKDNPIAPRTAGDFEPRTTAKKAFSLPHLWTPYDQPPFNLRDYRNIFDQNFVISSTLDADVKIEFVVLEVASSSEISTALFSIDLGTFSSSSQTIVTLTPEKSTNNSSPNVIELNELRQPYPAFRIDITPVTAPTIGEIKILNARRY